MLTIRELTDEAEWRAAFPLMRELRHRLTDAGAFAAQVGRQWGEGYRLVGGFTNEWLVALAGYRVSCTLGRGPHLFVDDLVTAEAERGRGHGRAMIAWLRVRAREAGVGRVYLDSRDTAVGFYEREGFAFLTSKVCWVDAAS